MSSVDEASPPYEGLSPELILAAVESRGYRCDGRQLALNSYENRVYQVGIEEASPLIAKFYRPGRWSDAQILEEHRFSQELAAQEIPVVAPLADESGRTLHAFEGFRFALYPRRGGRDPDLDNEQTLEWMGRFLGRMHLLGGREAYVHRPALDLNSFGIEPYQFLLQHKVIPGELEATYRSVVEDVLKRVEMRFEECGALRQIRLHGDCHRGNILWTDDGPHFVDFDDSRTGPAVQDLWMLLSGGREAMQWQLGAVLRGYQQFADFDFIELNLIEALRSLRLIHYSAWLARRWHDPAFPAAFPWFDTPRYWEEQILTLREQIAALEEPPLSIY